MSFNAGLSSCVGFEKKLDPTAKAFLVPKGGRAKAVDVNPRGGPSRFKDSVRIKVTLRLSANTFAKAANINQQLEASRIG